MGLKAGVVGLGILGEVHCSSLVASDLVERVVVCDLVQEKLDKALTLSKVKKGYKDLNEMLSSETLDVVVVATPDAYHYEPIMAAINAGVKNIISEKPLATDLGKARAIVKAAEDKGVRLTVLFSNRFLSLDLAFKVCMEHKLIGKPLYCDSRVDDNIFVPLGLWGEGSKAWASQSSPAHFLMSHFIDLLSWFLTPAQPKSVYAIAKKEVLKNTMDLYDSFIEFDDDTVVRIKSEWIKYMDVVFESYISLTGDQGTIIYNKAPGYNTTAGLQVVLSDEVPEQNLTSALEDLKKLSVEVNVIRSDEPGALIKRGLEIQSTATHDEFAWAMHYHLQGIVEDTLHPSNLSWGPLPDIYAGLRAVEVTNAIDESAASGKKVVLQ